jgi:hypothetical protein
MAFTCSVAMRIVLITISGFQRVGLEVVCLGLRVKEIYIKCWKGENFLFSRLEASMYYVL